MARRNGVIVVKPRFYLIFFGTFGIIVALILFFTRDTNTGSVKYGDVTTTIDLSGVIVRDESTVSTEQYQKITFSVVEGDIVSNGQEIACVYKRGFSEELLVSLQRVEREMLERQKMLISGTPQEEAYLEIEKQIEEVAGEVREAARDGGTADMLELENRLKELQTQRQNYLEQNVTADAELEEIYAERDGLEADIAEWERSIVNTAGSGTVSFYFDGYERVINASQLSMINSALINSVVKGGNTASTTTGTSSSTKELYRLVNSTDWYYAFVTDATEPFRTVKGERYEVTFPDYSDTVYHATAAEPSVTDAMVVNYLEFDVDIGEFLSIRSVKAVLTKTASGTVVPIEMLGYNAGVPYVLTVYGEETVAVPVNVYATDETNAVVEPKSKSASLSAGMKIQKPAEVEEDDDE